MSGLLSLKWNNHSIAFLNTVSNIRKKDQFCDATIICHGRYYPVHKFVLSTCSEYFEDIFEKINSKNPIIIIKDIEPKELELLLNYMYEGEVNVLQDLLPGLIKSAEALKIRGLAVPDDGAKNVSKNSRGKRYRTSSPISLNKRPRNMRRSEEVLQSSNDIQEDFNEINSDHDILSINKKLDCTDVSLEETNNRKIAVGDEKSNNTKCKNDTLYEQEQFNKSKLSDIKQEVIEESQENYGISFSECVNFKDENNINNEDEDSLTSQQGIPQCSTWNEIEPPFDGDCLSGLDEGTDEIDEYVGWMGNETSQLFTKNNQVIEAKKRHHCHSCTFSSNSFSSWKTHLLVHSGVKPFPCHLCSYKATTKQNIASHLMTRHTNEKPFICKCCDYRCATKFYLDRHMKVRHSAPNDSPIC